MGKSVILNVSEESLGAAVAARDISVAVLPQYDAAETAYNDP